MGHHLPVSIGQPVDRVEDCPPLDPGNDRRLGRWGRTSRDGVVGQAQAEPFLTSAAASLIESLVADDAKKPGSERRVDPESRHCVICLDECLLGHVFGLGPVTNDEKCHPKGDVPMGLHQCLEGSDIATLCILDQVLLVQWRPSTDVPRIAYTDRARSVPSIFVEPGAGLRCMD